MLVPKLRTLAFSVRSIHLSCSLSARNIKPYDVGLEGQYRKERSKKIIKIELPDFVKLRNENKLHPDEYISKLKEKGIAPPRKYKEKPIVINCIQGVLDPYVPPEGDGKYSILSQSGVGQKATHLKQKATSMLALRKIRSYEDDFDLPNFCEESLKIYRKAHELLAANSREELLDYVTEFAFPLMTFQTDLKTMKWNFIKSNDIPEVIQMRTQSLIEKNNMFAQVTVRFNTRQTLAIYDRFGHLMYGSEAIVKDVIEYVVFEKNISDYHGKWRIHSKIIPDWLPKKDPVVNTFVQEAAPEPPTEEELKFEKEGIVSSEKKNDEAKTTSN